MRPSHSGVSALIGSRTQVLLVVALALLVVAPATAHPAELASVDVGRPQLINRNSAGEVSSYSAAFGDLDRSGRYVAFYSSAPNLHPPGVDYTGVYLRDRRTGKTSTPVRNRHGKPNKMGSDNGRLSPNGRFLAYCSFDPNIVKPDSFEYDPGDLPFLPDYDVFVRDLRTGKTRRLSTAWNGKEADDYSCGATVADNGDTTFESEANNLVRHDPDGKEGGTFLYDWSSGRLHRLGQLDHDVMISATAPPSSGWPGEDWTAPTTTCTTTSTCCTGVATAVPDGSTSCRGSPVAVGSISAARCP